MSRILSFLATFLLLFVVFIIASASISPMDIVLGLITSVIVAAFSSTLLIKEAPTKVFNVIRWAWAIAYFFYYFLIIEPKCHWDVVKRILHPKMPIKPGIVRVPYDVKSDYTITAVACSITNTPGTVVVDVDEEGKKYYVHWIDVKATDPKVCHEMISKTFEKYLRRVFD
ncbi:MAG: Na+/H+ antiporter subunit E [Candidatus Nezhaarchaeales archaeon]|nr:MAG: cation:proton antiporter [Candidatus Nezhaarchaeota archaeon WYZ-LMO8]TDA37010.1 MAG: cation:proton antiporter [Candidatus Nezhaarchaeota archaeon WYZ-LMO7]